MASLNDFIHFIMEKLLPSDNKSREIMDKSQTNSTTNLTAVPAKSAILEGLDRSLLTFKIMLLLLIGIDLFFLGLFVPTTRQLFSFQFLCIYGYMMILLIGGAAVVVNYPRLLLPLYTVWVCTMLATILVLIYSSWEYSICSWKIYFKPDSDIRHVCSWTFIATYADATIYFMILGFKLSQVFLAHVVLHLQNKSIRIQSFDARKHGPESDDEDMIVFERIAGNGRNSPGKVRDAAIA